MAVEYPVYAPARAGLVEAVREYDIAAQQFIARQALPIYGVEQEGAALSVQTRESILRPVDTTHKDGSAYARSGIALKDLPYLCKEQGFEEPITDVARRRFKSDFDAEKETVEVAVHRFLVAQERRASALLFNTTTWNGATLYTDNKATPWSTAASSAIGHIMAAKAIIRANIGEEPNALIIGAAALDNLLKNTEILARFVGAGVITQAMLAANMAAIFGLEKLIVGKKVYNSAKEGQTFVSAQVWDYKYAMLAKVADGDGAPLAHSGLGRTLLWTEDSPENEVIEQYRSNEIRGDVFRVRNFVMEVVFDAYFAHLMRIET